MAIKEKPAKPEYQEIPFATQADFREWLHKNHATSPGIWIKMFKKATGIKSLNWKEAVPVALCYGWIDGQSRPGDDTFWFQKFTPRGKRSMWSQINRDHIKRLTTEGKMHPAGIAEVERAKADGRWEAAYAPPSQMSVPDDFLKELAKYPDAEAFYKTLNKSNTYAIAYRLTTAKKPETRQRRFENLLQMMKEEKKIH